MPWPGRLTGREYVRSQLQPFARMLLAAACLLASPWLSPTSFPWLGTARAECIDYGNYLHWFTELRTVPGQVTAVTVSGSYSYLLSDEGSLHVVDIADPARPSIVGSDDTLEYGLRDLAVSGGHAYVVGTIAGLEVVDITNPATPLRVGGLEVPGEAWGVAVSGSFAYVAARGGGLHVVDITDPFNPQIVGALPALDDARKVVVVGAYAYVAGGYQGFHVIDITDPTTPN